MLRESGTMKGYLTSNIDNIDDIMQKIKDYKIENVFESFNVPDFARANVLKFISEKNAHDLEKYCLELKIEREIRKAAENAIAAAKRQAATTIPKETFLFIENAPY